jgi:hypothetical protein
MNFKDFKSLFQQNAEKIFKNHSTLFTMDTDSHKIWDLYLDSFPEGTNNIFRERREYDCSCCKQFIRSFGNVVAIEKNKLISIWDFETNDDKYQPVIDALSAYVKSVSIKDVFVTKDRVFGTGYSHEQFEDGTTHRWDHFRIKLPVKFLTDSHKSEASLMGSLRDTRNVFKRSLDEISADAIETILDLVSQNSLYKGHEWNAVLTKFLKLHKEYNALGEDEKELYCWSVSVEIGGVIGKIRNHSIGVLLTDITDGIDLDVAVKRYESIVAPTNYKRPKAIFTKKMISEAKKTIERLGFLDSLGRRHANIEDITVNNILFANKDSLKKITGDVFDELENEVPIQKQFKHVEEVNIETFVSDILPRTTNIELFFENKHTSNLMSLIAPKVDSPTMFKWDNNFSWAYNGNITDSMKQRVKAAGGNVEGVLRFSIQWNEENDNGNDFDAHCNEPNGNHIWYKNAKVKHPSTAMLDVDIIDPGNKTAVENITWTNINKMQEGEYMFSVHNFSHRGGTSGFRAEIEYDGQIYSYDYGKAIGQGENVIVAKVEFSREKGVKFIESLESSVSPKTEWGIQTQVFHPASVFMFSPNYWDEQKGIGHKHYFFILKNCINDNRPNGFFNEFLKEDLMEHKRVFEALGSKMKVDESNIQLSGLGFSSTKRNYVICKIQGHMERTIKLTF